MRLKLCILCRPMPSRTPRFLRMAVHPCPCLSACIRRPMTHFVAHSRAAMAHVGGRRGDRTPATALSRPRVSNPAPYHSVIRPLAEGVGVEPTRHWLALTVFKTAATANWLAPPLCYRLRRPLHPTPLPYAYSTTAPSGVAPNKERHGLGKQQFAGPRCAVLLGDVVTPLASQCHVSQHIQPAENTRHHAVYRCRHSSAAAAETHQPAAQVAPTPLRVSQNAPKLDPH